MLIGDFFYLQSSSSSILLILRYTQHRVEKNLCQLEYLKSFTLVKGAAVRKVSCTLPTLLFSFLKRIFSEDCVGNVENDGFLYFHYKLFKDIGKKKNNCGL